MDRKKKFKVKTAYGTKNMTDCLLMIIKTKAAEAAD